MVRPTSNPNSRLLELIRRSQYARYTHVEVGTTVFQSVRTGGSASNQAEKEYKPDQLYEVLIPITAEGALIRLGPLSDGRSGTCVIGYKKTQPGAIGPAD